MQTLIRRHHSVFVGALVSGLAVIILLGDRHRVALTLTLSIMGAYLIVLSAKARSPHAHENDADTFYYLGFLFTLATLIRSFWPYMPFFHAGEPQVTEGDVLGLFGLGLVTTLVGLAGRLVLTRVGTGQQPGLDSKTDVLAEKFADLADEVRKAAIDFANHRELLKAEMAHISSAGQGIAEEYGKKLGEHLEALFKDLRAHVQKSAEAAATSTQGLASSLKSVGELVDESQSGIHLKSKKLRRAIDRLAGNVEKTNLAMERVVEKLEGVSSMNEPLKKLAEEAEEHLRVVRQHRVEMEAALKKSSTAMLEVHERLVQCTQSITRIVAGEAAQ
jgi:hypothetical protein